MGNEVDQRMKGIVPVSDDEVNDLFIKTIKTTTRHCKLVCCIADAMKRQGKKLKKLNARWTEMTSCIQAVAVNFSETGEEVLSDMLNALCFDLYEMTELEGKRYSKFSRDYVRKVSETLENEEKRIRLLVEKYQCTYNRFTDEINFHQFRIQNDWKNHLNKKTTNELLALRYARIYFLDETIKMALSKQWQQIGEFVGGFFSIEDLTNAQLENCKSIINNLRCLSEISAKVTADETGSESFLKIKYPTYDDTTESTDSLMKRSRFGKLVKTVKSLFA